MRNILLAAIVLGLSEVAFSQDFNKEYINPSSGYSNAVAVTSGSTKTIYIAGQVGSGDTLEDQIRSSFQGVLKQLADAKASFSDVVKMNTYIVNYRQEDLVLFRRIRKEMFGEQNMPANTLVGVTSLATDDIKVEMDAVAILPVQ